MTPCQYTAGASTETNESMTRAGESPVPTGENHDHAGKTMRQIEQRPGHAFPVCPQLCSVCRYTCSAG